MEKSVKPSDGDINNGLPTEKFVCLCAFWCAQFLSRQHIEATQPRIYSHTKKEHLNTKQRKCTRYWTKARTKPKERKKKGKNGFRCGL